MKVLRPLVLLILDGWGIGKNDEHNAIFLAKTPTMDYLLSHYPHGAIGAAGEHLGLEPGHQGSTEMGHLVISAGRNVLLAQNQMQHALRTDGIRSNIVYREGIQRAKKNNARVHLMGLLSDAGVHSYDAVCHELLALCADESLQHDQVFVHIISDGRDTPPTSLPTFVARLQKKMRRTGVGVIASLQGRWWVMDRDHRWERIEASYNMLTRGQEKRTAATIENAIIEARAHAEDDEFISPTVIDPAGIFRDDDTVINFNYRVDREIEITQALVEENFEAFPRTVWPNIHYIATLPYYAGMAAAHAFEREELKMKNILPEVVSAHGLTQYRLTETEKWVYVTKIFNGMREEAFPGETRKLIPSDKVPTFDMQPEMQAATIADDAVAQLQKKAYDVYILNICNADMLGHTGNKSATIKGCEAIDAAVKIIYKEIQRQHGILLITADHGSAEKMWDHHNALPHTQHTDSFVPFILVDDERKNCNIRDTGSLVDVAPTILELLNIPKPAEMTGSSLIIPHS